jgi:catechol-2,3-dioxygenase
MTSPSKFAHVVFATHRYEEMIDFYLSVFDATAAIKTDEVCFATYDEEHHRFAFMNLGSIPEGWHAERLPKGLRPGVAHLAYTWDNLAGLVGVYKRVLKLYGKKPFACVRHGPTLSMYYRDPDGNNLEFQIDLLDADAANEFMRGPAFAANPIGEPFDPAELAHRFDAGKPLRDCIFRSDQPAVEMDGVTL